MFIINLLTFLSFAIFAFVTIRLFFSLGSKNTVKADEIKKFTPSELQFYDGSNPDLPIYLALDGKVYNVTAGKKIYKKGAIYHFLVGKDSSVDLREVAVDILIKNKYPAVGYLVH